MYIRERSSLLVLVVVAFVQSLWSQPIFKAYEDSLVKIQRNLYTSKKQQIRFELNERFKTVFESALKQPNSFDYPFDSLKEIGRIYAPDRVFRLITWDLQKDDGSHDYFGFIQYLNPKTKQSQLVSLVNKADNNRNQDNSIGDAAKWFGMLYYKIIPVKSKGKRLYTLLGMNCNDRVSNRKIIDVLYFLPDGSPHFGAPLFRYNNKAPRRIIFEFSPQAVMSLKYEESSKRIVFDHLSPSEPKFEGQFQYYGPDFSIDAFEFKKGKWVYKPDIDARNKSTSKDADYNNPLSPKKDHTHKQFYDTTH